MRKDTKALTLQLSEQQIVLGARALAQAMFEMAVNGKAHAPAPAATAPLTVESLNNAIEYFDQRCLDEDRWEFERVTRLKIADDLRDLALRFLAPGFVRVPREVLEAVLAHYSEFENDLDETDCPTGWVECPVCEQGGSHDGRHKRPIQHETDGCPNKVIRELLDAAGDGK